MLAAASFSQPSPKGHILCGGWANASSDPAPPTKGTGTMGMLGLGLRGSQRNIGSSKPQQARDNNGSGSWGNTERPCGIVKGGMYGV